MTQEYRSEKLEHSLRKLHLVVKGLKASVIVNVDGLLVACRALGISNDATMLFRMQRDMQRLGIAAGVAAALRERNPAVKIGIADPHGSALYSYFTKGELAAHGESIAEGVGVSFVPGNLQGTAVDLAFAVDDDTALPFVYGLLKHEGVSVGPSSGINIAGAVAMARELGPGHTIVTILCDSGSRYLDQLYNAEFLWSRKLPVPDWIVA